MGCSEDALPGQKLSFSQQQRNEVRAPQTAGTRCTTGCEQLDGLVGDLLEAAVLRMALGILLPRAITWSWDETNTQDQKQKGAAARWAAPLSGVLGQHSHRAGSSCEIFPISDTNPLGTRASVFSGDIQFWPPNVPQAHGAHLSCHMPTPTPAAAAPTRLGTEGGTGSRFPRALNPRPHPAGHQQPVLCPKTCRQQLPQELNVSNQKFMPSSKEAPLKK